LARPHVFSLLFTVLWYAILNEYQYRTRSHLWLMPFVMLIWVNLHGGFVIGFVLLGIYFVGNLLSALFSTDDDRHLSKQRCKKLLVVTAGTLCLSLLNPVGYSILLFPLETVSNQFVMNNVLEFLSPNFHGQLPFKYLLLLTVGVTALSRKSLDIIQLTLFLLFLYMSLYSARYIPLFAIIVAPIVTRQLNSLIPSETRAGRFLQERSKNLQLADASARGFLWPIAAVSVIFTLAVAGSIQFNFSDAKLPVHAVEFLKKESIKGKMFNNDEFGDYLIYAAWPKYKVFFDGRSDMYGEKWGMQYLKVVRLQPGWEQVLEKNRMTWVFCHAASPLSAILLENKDWQLIYADKLAHIFVKRIPAYRSLIETHRDIKPFPRSDTGDIS